MNKNELLELNVRARELKREGNFEEIRKLCLEKGISEDTIANFILGTNFVITEEAKTEEKKETKKVVNTIDDEDIDVTVIVPFYKSVEEKLEQEQEDLLKTVKNEKQKAFIKEQLKVIIEYILKDEDRKVKAFYSWKELTRCYQFMTEHAKEYALNGVACISDSTVFEWIDEYYRLDDQTEVEEKRRKKAINELKLAKIKEEAEKKKKKPRKPRKTKAEKEAEEKAKAEKAKAEKDAKEEEKADDEKGNKGDESTENAEKTVNTPQQEV